ncbi:MAG: cytochrome c3 family protein [Candidatus Eisenbacteria sp.]|nr:cytochrome c3 family protein [Candidatus Eisenbacteria bacterium]
MRIRLLASVALVGILLILVHALVALAGPGRERDLRESILDETIEIDREAQADAESPGTITYETWFGDGTRVSFDHALHIEGLELSCGECHHAEGCGQCHQKQATKMLIRDSGTALHQVCFRCHEQASGRTGCTECHVGGASGGGSMGLSRSPKLGRETQEAFFTSMLEDIETMDLVGERGPIDREVSKAPEDCVFVTGHNGVSIVSFPHGLHAEDAGISCGACHHLEACSVCHDGLQKSIAVRSAESAVRDDCVRCHEKLGLSTQCDQCHSDPHRR